MKVLITPRGFAKYGLNEVKMMEEKGLQVHYNSTGNAYTPETFLELGRDADAIIVGVDIIDKTFIDQCPHLKVICKFGVGTDNIDVDYAASKGIVVGKTLGSNSIAVAEHVVALMFADAKNLYPTLRDVKAHQWLKPTGYEINGKTLGIIGFGAIGKHLAAFANGLGMHVLAYDVFDITQETADEYKVHVSTIHDILEQADYISLHVPLLDSTKDMISTEQFKQMKLTACLLNTARGGVVNEKALYEALVAHDIRSAAFDVFTTEPPKADEPLLGLDNFLLTSHTASRTEESEQRTCAISTGVIVDVLLGEKHV